MRAIRYALVLAAAVGLEGLTLGCGASYNLPKEVFRPAIPPDKAYKLLASWPGMEGVKDILLTQQGSQLFILFNDGPGGGGTAPRGRVQAFLLSDPTPVAGIDFPELFNPVALCAGGGSIFVLDQGDTCIARTNPTTGTCDTTGQYLGQHWNNRITDIAHYWYVREYSMFGGAVQSAFTDTSMASVEGVAADAQGRVYVSGTAIILDAPDDPRLRTRKFVSVIRRYLRGGPPDPNMPGSNWHRDLTWSVDQGTGFGYVVDPRGLHWGPYGGGGIYCAVFGRNYAQRFSDAVSNTAITTGDQPAFSTAEDIPLEKPVDVYSDLDGFVYVVDEGNARVLRFGPDKLYVQRVDFEPNALDPVAVATDADGSHVYVADRGRGVVLRLERRP